jgi:hypothetical protein
MLFPYRRPWRPFELRTIRLDTLTRSEMSGAVKRRRLGEEARAERGRPPALEDLDEAPSSTFTVRI